MKLLAFDTSSELCAVAVYDCQEREFLAKSSENIGRGHAERLMGLIGHNLQDAGLGYRDIGRIAVTTGPGSFTGIRVGLATARGLALGLNIPITGVSVLEAIAFERDEAQPTNKRPLVVAMDARRKEVFMQVFQASKSEISPPQAVPVSDIGKHIPNEAFSLAGSAADMIVLQTGRQDIDICSNQASADIAAITRLAAQMPLGLEKPKPLYLRKADAKPQKPLLQKAN